MGVFSSTEDFGDLNDGLRFAGSQTVIEPAADCTWADAQAIGKPGSRTLLALQELIQELRKLGIVTHVAKVFATDAKNFCTIR